MMISKSDTVRELVANGEYKKALNIIKGFRLGLSSEDISSITLAYECLTHERFYQELGINTAGAINEGIRLLLERYGQSE